MSFFRLPFRKRTPLRLISDHHQLVLKFFCFKKNSWTHLAQTKCERLTEAIITSWLKSNADSRSVTIELLLAEDHFQFLTPDHKLKAPEQSPEWICEIGNEFSLDLETLMLDAYYQDQSLHIVLLNKASVMSYLQAFKTCKMSVQRIAPVHLPHLNLLPWREKKAKYTKYLSYFKLSLFPIFALIILMMTQEWTSAQLQKLKSQNQRLNQQLQSIEPTDSAIVLKKTLPFIEQAIQKGDGLNLLQIDQTGEIHLSGTAKQQGLLHSMLNRFANLPQIEPNSMQNWTLRQHETGTAWSVNYRLKKATS